MTHPITEESSAAERPRAEGFLDWFHINSRWVGIGAVAVLVAIFVAWYVQRDKAVKNENADKQLLAAKQSFASGNAQLAESDLQRVADRYAGTSAGAEAGLLLGQLKLDKGDYQGAAAYLQKLVAGQSTGPNAASARSLLGDALAQLNKPAEAAAEYERAAGLTSMPNEKALLLAKAGHAYMAAEKRPEARKIWEALEAQTDNAALADEARVRLGELAAASTAAKS
jgi:predicted negative regulator of RcsB-dependent stress response